MELKAKLMDEAQIMRSLARMAHEIIEKTNGAENICLVGIKRRGIPLAKLLSENIRKFANVDVPVGEIDVTLHRDDLNELPSKPETVDSRIPCELKRKTVILVDDVLYTGRTARAAMDALLDFGRPAVIRLAVLVDRGHRELPIRPDFVGKNVPTSHEERVHVSIVPTDDKNEVELYGETK